MTNSELLSYNPYEAFRVHFNSLAAAGYYKIISGKNYEGSKLYRMHQIHKCFVFLLMLAYSFSQAMFIVMVWGDWEQVVSTLLAFLCMTNAISKNIALHLNTARVDRLLNTIHSPYFAAIAPEDLECLKSNATYTKRLLRFFQVNALTTVTLWSVVNFVGWLRGEKHAVKLYLYYSMDNVGPFVFGLALWECASTFAAFGQVTVDCTITAFYAQARTQLRILRNHLENFTKDEIHAPLSFRRPYIDSDVCVRKRLYKKFVHCVKHHQTINWYINEIDVTFNQAMVIQLLVAAFVLGLAILHLAKPETNFLMSMHLAILLCNLLAELFVYCYFGSQVIAESEMVNASALCTGWQHLSPRFRALQLVAMVRWHRPAQPRIAHLVPLSLNTFVGVVKFSYSLYTCFSRT